MGVVELVLAGPPLPPNFSVLAEQTDSLHARGLSFRAKEFKTRLGVFLHKSELSSDTGGISKFEWTSKHSKER